MFNWSWARSCKLPTLAPLVAAKSSTKNERTRGVEERDMTCVDEEELEEEQDPRVTTTYPGRILKLPNRFYWKHGLMKAQWVEQ